GAQQCRIVSLACAVAVAFAVIEHGLLREPGHVRLDVENHGPAEAGDASVTCRVHALHELCEAGVVARHDAGAVEVGEIRLARAAAAAGAAAAEDVVAEDGNVAVAARSLCVEQRELCVAVPALPACGEELEGEVPRNVGARHPAVNAVVVWSTGDSEGEVRRQSPFGGGDGGGGLRRTGLGRRD